MNPNTPSPEMNFEHSFKRLETILEKMNSGTITLDESLKLYTEADRLINECMQKLNDAEKTIEVLIKNRSGELVINAEGKPQLKAFEGSP